MKVLQINSMLLGSTGNIMLHIAAVSEKYGIDAYIGVSRAEQIMNFDYRQKKDCQIVYIGGFVDFALHHLLGRLTGLNGCYSRKATARFINKIKKIDPDIIHIHNLHNCYINWEMLFQFLKEEDKDIIWTLHDAWAVTGNCVHFDSVKCNKWKTECCECPIMNQYPKIYKDKTRYLFKLKKEVLNNTENLTIVTPSVWLQQIVQQSFLSKFNSIVIQNGVDRNVFKPVHSNLKEKYNIRDKFILLGVSRKWNQRKGLDVFLKLAKILDDRFQIILVGTKGRNLGVDDIICIDSMSNQDELAKIYTMADLFINPTREDNFPTVNLEALSCGTPIVTFDTGGSGEVIESDVGYCVKQNDLNGLVQAILQEFNAPKERCRIREISRKYDRDDKFAEYIKLYKNIYSKNL